MFGKIGCIVGFFYFYLFVSAIIGLISAFSNSIILGILSIFVSPYACVSGILYPFMNLSEIIQNWVHFPI